MSANNACGLWQNDPVIVYLNFGASTLPGWGAYFKAAGVPGFSDLPEVNTENHVEREIAIS